MRPGGHGSTLDLYNQLPPTIQEEGSEGDPDCTAASVTQGVVGTPLYTPPELMRGKPFNEKVDVYSLGIILCELFVPFNTAMERIHVLTELREGSMPTELVDQHPRVAQLVKEMMVDNHLQRPSAKELLERIDELTPAPPVPPPADAAE